MDTEFEMIGGYPCNKKQCGSCPDKEGSNVVYVGSDVRTNAMNKLDTVAVVMLKKF